MSGREGNRNRVYEHTQHNSLFCYEACLIIFVFHRRQEETAKTTQERQEGPRRGTTKYFKP